MTRKTMVLCLLLATGMGLGAAQQPVIPAELPQFALPRDFAPTPPDLNGVSGGLLKAIRDKFECKKCNGQEPGGRVGAVMVKLGSLGQAALVTSYAADRCNDNGACSVWLFLPQGGGYAATELDWGTTFVVLTTASKPVPDLAIRGSAGGKKEFVHLFSYINGQYRAAGCDALVDKNDMGDVTVGACR